jgi:hypothetical protein
MNDMDRTTLILQKIIIIKLQIIINILSKFRVSYGSLFDKNLSPSSSDSSLLSIVN